MCAETGGERKLKMDVQNSPLAKSLNEINKITDKMCMEEWNDIKQERKSKLKTQNKKSEEMEIPKATDIAINANETLLREEFKFEKKKMENSFIISEKIEKPTGIIVEIEPKLIKKEFNSFKSGSILQ